MRETICAFALLACTCFLHEKIDAVCDQAWVGDSGQNIVIIDTVSQTQSNVFSPGDLTSTGIAFTPDGNQVFLTSNNGIFAIDASTHTATQISTQTGAVDVVVSPNGQFAYVAVQPGLAGEILQINTTTHAVTPLNGAYPLVPNGIGITPNGSQLYLVGEATALVIDPTSGSVLHTISIPSATNLFKVAFTPNGTLAYVTDNGNPEILGNVFQINTSSFAVAATSSGIFMPFSSPWGVAINPNGQFAYVTDQTNNSVYVIQISTNTAVNYLSDPDIRSPQGVAVTPDGAFVYVADFLSSNTVSVINASTFAINDVPTGAIEPVVVAISPPCTPPINSLPIKGRIVTNKDFWQTNISSQLCWNAPVGFNPVYYLIFRNGEQIGTVNAGQTFFEDNYLRPGKTYNYSIFAVNNLNVEILVGTITLTTR